jgi:hypothetical protein
VPELAAIDGLSAMRDGVGAVLFMQATMVQMDVMSALNSSPWTSENFGASPEKAATAREYVRHALIIGSAIDVVAALVAQSLWPLIGGALTGAYLWWIYERALQRGATSGSTDWGQ